MSCLSFSEEYALDLYSMKKFCSDKMVNLMTPSQKRQGSCVYALTFFPPCSCCFSPWCILKCWCCYCCRSLSGLSWVKATHRDTHERKSPMKSGHSDIIPTSFFCEISFTLWYFLFYITLKDVACHPSCTCELSKSFYLFPWYLVHIIFLLLCFPISIDSRNTFWNMSYCNALKMAT